MVDTELGLAVVFNGCIYNHRELRRELEAAGHRFSSTSDTEVLLKGWAEWGEDLKVVTALYERGRRDLTPDDNLSVDGVKEMVLVTRDRLNRTLPRVAGRLSIMRSPSIETCSIITTASAPAGTAAPVMICTHSPGPTTPSNPLPALISPVQCSVVPGTASSARTAKPSRIERSNGG